MTRTSVYIDGYNLYYSRLKGTPYKWLDIAALFRDRILLPQDPGMIEEKQTDVNIALHAYRDAVRGECEQLVLCSNDSDLEPALRMVREDAPGARLG